MTDLRLLLALLIVAGCAPRDAEPRHDEVPFMVQSVQEAAARSSLGNLASTVLPADDVELRLWGGFGAAGTHGIVLRRSAGVWALFEVRLQNCVVIVPAPAADTLSTEGEARYESSALRDCRENPPGQGRWLAFERVLLTPREFADGAATWSSIVEAGLDSLPDLRESAPEARDGHTVVVEVRRAAVYRAAEISCNLGADALPNAHIDAVFAAAGRSLPNGGWLVCH